MSDDAPDLQIREEHDDAGNLRGRWTAYEKEGEEILHGEYELFHANGLRAEQRFFEHGKPAGVWAMWDDVGRELHKGPPPETPSEPVAEPSPEDWDAPLVDESEQKPKLPWLEYSLEFGVVMALGWFSPFIVAIVSQGFLSSPSDWRTFVEEGDYEYMVSEAPNLALSLQVFIPLLWIIWKSDLSWKDVGVVRPTFKTAVLLGVAVCAGSLIIDAALVWLMDPPEPPGLVVYPVKPFFWGVLVVGMLLNSLAEEFVWRGYVLKRLSQMSGSKLFALGVSTLLFASYHIYQGFENMVLVIPTGLIFGAVVLVTRRIWPVVVAHTIFNVVLYTSLGEWLYSW